MGMCTMPSSSAAHSDEVGNSNITWGNRLVFCTWKIKDHLADQLQCRALNLMLQVNNNWSI